MEKEAELFSDFNFIARHLAKVMIDIIQESVNTFNKKELLEKLDRVRVAVRDLEYNPSYQFKNKKYQKEYRTILKQLKAGCDKVEKVIMKGSVLYIF